MTAAIVDTAMGLRETLGGRAPGFVPTMGALHAGHAALIERAAAENAVTVVSVFVNPTQFADPTDLARYPREPDRDVAFAARHGADLVFAPPVTEIYPAGFGTSVDVPALAARWEGGARRGHFRGVATVVARLLGLVRPSRAYFGEKDFQQLQIVRRLHADLAFPGEIVACPTVRDADGLAISSRNGRLSAAGRRSAAAIPRALRVMVEIAARERGAAVLVAAGESVLRAEPGVALDYLAIVDPKTLEPLDRAAAGARAIVAAEIEGVRLIDNVGLDEGAVAWGS